MKADAGSTGRRHRGVEVSAEATSAIVDGLLEKTEYMLTVTTVTEEFFDNLEEGANCFTFLVWQPRKVKKSQNEVQEISSGETSLTLLFIVRSRF